MTREERLSSLRKEKSLPLDEGGKTLMETVVILLGKGDQITLQLFIFLFVRRLARRLRERWRNSIVIFQLMESSGLPNVAGRTLCLLHGASCFFLRWEKIKKTPSRVALWQNVYASL